MNSSYLTKFSLPIKGGCVVTCIVDVDVAKTRVEMRVGGIVDPPVVKEKDMVIFVLNMTSKEKPYTTQIAINCMGMFYKLSLLLKLLQVQRIFDTHLRQLSIFTENQVLFLRSYI